MDKVRAAEAAKLLGVSVEDLAVLKKQGLLSPINDTKGETFYSATEILEIKSRHGQTLADEAGQVNIQIQRQVVTSVSGLMTLRKKVFISGSAIILVLISLYFSLSFLFYKYPLRMSDFFGYYYRYNASEQQPQVSDSEDGDVLAASTGLGGVAANTTVLADVIKPVAAASLVMVKAVDNEKYAQIVTNPIESIAISTLVGNPGPSGANGVDGDVGSSGQAGAQGPVGPSGSGGTDGSDGSDGTSFADVLATVGDILIRDENNATTRLSAGSDGQVLSISSGIPKWDEIDVSGLTNADLSGSAGITNDNLANSTLTISAGEGLAGGGIVSLGDSTTLDIDLATSGTTGLTSSNSGLEVSDSGLTLIHGCADGEVLKWTDGGGWACASVSAGSDLQHAASYDTNEAEVNVTSSQTTLGTVSVTPQTSTADIYVTGQAEVISRNALDQPFTLVIETTSNCTGTTVGNASVTYTITSGDSAPIRGVLEVSGIDLNPGTSSMSYSLCGSTSAGDTGVQNWRLEALVIN